MLELTQADAELVGRGLRSAVRSSGYDKAVGTLRQQYKDQIMNSAPGEKEYREQMYQRAQAFEDMLGILETFVVIAERAALDAEQDDLT